MTTQIELTVENVQEFLTDKINNDMKVINKKSKFKDILDAFLSIKSWLVMIDHSFMNTESNFLYRAEENAYKALCEFNKRSIKLLKLKAELLQDYK